MTEQPNTPDPTGDPSNPPQPTFEPITSQDEFDKRTKARVAREAARYADYEALKTAAAELAQIKQANLTEAERQSERIRELETQLESERHANTRRDVAAAKGVPAHRILGTNREELEQSAEDYLAEIAALNTPPAKTPRPVGALKSGASNSDSRMDPKARAAAALRQWRGG